MDFKAGLNFADTVLSASYGVEKVRLSSGKTIQLKLKQTQPQEDVKACLTDTMDTLLGNLSIKKAIRKPKPKPQPQGNGKVLWTEKWRPSTYLDLIGNERTNRLTLEWLSQWSKAVFNTTNEMCDRNKEQGDPLGRPHNKILLLNGPPGIGKTSIAHVIARQIGYEVLEINASDERVNVRDKIRNALTSRTFSGKPTCLVVDEIDGSTEQGFIKVLLELLYEDDRAKNNQKKKAKFLMRPIIACCNDLYAAPLEKLRPRAEIISMRHPPRRAIKDRLRKIGKAENLAISDRVLEAVVETCNFDMRGCLNMLQFSQGSSTNGSKDLQSSWFSLVRTTFTRDNSVKLSQQYAELEKLLVNADEKVVNGCFNVYLGVGVQNLDLLKCDALVDWLYFADVSSETYNSLAVLKFFLLFSGTSTEVKTANLNDFYEQRRRHTQMLKQFSSAVAMPSEELVRYGIPLATAMLCTNMKPTHTMKPHERAKMECIRGILKQFNIKIHRNFTGYELYPQIDALCTFNEQQLKQQELKRQPLLVLLNEERGTKRKPEVTEPLEPQVKRNVNADFFKKQYGELAEALPKSTENRIWVKYHEGFSNAVKKNIRWSDLFA